MSEVERQLRILETLERNPETTQASLAAQLGMAVGSVNWYLKRLIRKGYVKATKMERRRLKYFVTPQGLALKARLTAQYMEASLRAFRELRKAAQETLTQVRQRGHTAVRADGRGEAMEIFRLTCLEAGVRIEKDLSIPLPSVQAAGMSFVVEWPGQTGQSGENMATIDPKAASQHYYEREARRRAQREAERQEWLQRVREAASRLAAHYPGVRRVYLYGSLIQPGRFRPDSDIDVAVECDTVETESAFWRALELELGRDVDVRPLTDVIAEAAMRGGEEIYGRQDSHPGT